MIRVNRGYSITVITLLVLLLNGFLIGIPAFAETDKPALLLPTVYKEPKNVGPDWIGNYWVSEKLDGIRGHWTGKQLLTKQGNPIHTPSGFTKHWPKYALDGELWLGRDQFERISSIVRRKNPAINDWEKMRFMVFDLPGHKGVFSERVQAMQQLLARSKSRSLGVIKQFKVSSLLLLKQRLDQVVDQRGEGLMLHHQDAYYRAGRSRDLMKLKKHYDAEATVVDHIEGKGKYVGQLGALLVITKGGITFKIGTGFSDAQRNNPPPIGSVITFKYFGKTAKGVPRFASFMRIRSNIESQ